MSILPQGTEYWGYDISPEYIDSAQRRFGRRAEFHCGHFNTEQVAISPKFNLVIAIGVLHHLGDEEARNLFGLAKQALSPRGRVVTVGPCFTQI